MEKLDCMWQLHATNPLRSMTYISKQAGANQSRLLRHCSQRAAAAIQPAG